MTTPRSRVAVGVVAGLCATVAFVAPATLPTAFGTPRPAEPGVSALPLGPADLPQTVTSSTVQPGVTYTRIERGRVDAATRWVVEVNIPATTSSPDPDAPARSVQDHASASGLVAELAAAGFSASADPVQQDATVDLAASVIGYRVRLTSTYATLADANAAVAAVKAAGFSCRAWYQGWDGASTAVAHWTINVVTIDPRAFKGNLAATYGPDIQQRETTTALSAFTGADAAINAGFFVLDPAAGAPGDPAGVGVYNGALESETVAGRPAVVFDRNAQHTQIVRPTWRGSITAGKTTTALDGINRVPGLIRNCGGDAGDLVTSLPLHDITCTDPSELVVFDAAYGPTPTGAGAEAVIDAKGRVVSVSATRGTTLATGQHSLQAIGNLTSVVANLRVGAKVSVSTSLTAPAAGALTRPGRYVVNGGPQLLNDGATYITQATDGMVHPDDPSFAYGWVLQRNPRTFIGTNAAGQTLLVAVDGRQLNQAGLSIPETAAVARALGMVDAMNLDGGGSTAMAINGTLVNSPSDATGERPVGDAIVVLPKK